MFIIIIVIVILFRVFSGYSYPAPHSFEIHIEGGFSLGVIGFSSVEKNNHLNLLIHLLSVFEHKYGARPMLDIGDKIQFLSSKTPQITQNDMYIKTVLVGASLVAQWLRICLLMQGTRVRALVWEDPTCRRATRPVSHNY